MAGVHVKQHRPLREEGQAPCEKCLFGDAFGAPPVFGRVSVAERMNLPSYFMVATPMAISRQCATEIWLYADEASLNGSHAPILTSHREMHTGGQTAE